MNLIDILNRFGKNKRLRPIGQFLLWIVRRFSFMAIARMAGRTIVSASAGAPSILLTNSTITEAAKDPKLLYKAAEYSVNTMGLDTLFLFVDMSLEAEACGCQVHFDDYHLPSVITHPVKTLDDLSKLKVPDPERDGRLPVFLEAMRMMRNNFTMIKLAVVSGPFTLALSLAGTDIYLDTKRNKEKVNAILDYCEKVIIRYAQAMIKAGVDMIIIAEPAGSQLSVPAYEAFSLAYTKKIISALNRICILHICGKAGHLIPPMCRSGADGLSLDDVDMTQVIQQVPDNIVVIGNINTLKFSKSSPEIIKEDTLKLLDLMKARREFIAAPGCDLSPDTPPGNITIFTGTVKTYHNRV